MIDVFDLIKFIAIITYFVIKDMLWLDQYINDESISTIYI